MVQLVVTGVDSSETALNAALKAAELADGFGADLHVVSAYSRGGAYSLQPPIQSQVEGSSDDAVYRRLTEGLAGAARQIVESVADVLRESHPSLTVTTSIQDGAPADVLLGTAVGVGADLIVVGNKRVQGLARILGSVARKVAAEATCDLYIVDTTQR